MLQAIGAPLMQAAIPVMRAMTEMFSSIGEFASKNPEAIKTIGVGFAALGAALIGAGALAIIGAIGTGGWLLVGLAALGTALVALKLKFAGAVDSQGKKLPEGQIISDEDGAKMLGDAHKWLSAQTAEMGAAFQKWSADINSRIFAYVDGVGAAWARELPKLPGMISSGISSAVAGIAAAINAALAAIPGMLTGLGNWAKGEAAKGLENLTKQGPQIPQENYRALIPKDQRGALDSPYHFASRQAPGIQVASAGNYWPASSSLAVHSYDGISRKPGAPPRDDRTITINNVTNLDGKVIAKSTTKYQTAMARMPRGIHGMADDYGSYVGPGSTWQPA
jgi:hypothetical protein